MERLVAHSHALATVVNMSVLVFHFPERAAVDGRWKAPLVRVCPTRANQSFPCCYNAHHQGRVESAKYSCPPYSCPIVHGSTRGQENDGQEYHCPRIRNPTPSPGKRGVMNFRTDTRSSLRLSHLHAVRACRRTRRSCPSRRARREGVPAVLG
jgi:hypothetical protein